MKVAVVTPTVGRSDLKQCLEGVKNQTYKDITHYIFVDGQEYFDKVKEMTKDYDVKHVWVEDNTGKGGWYGQRLYASCSFLVNADIICYVDEDNWYDPDHIETQVKKLIEGNHDWVYSLRKIYDKEGNYLFEDNCESLGKWPVYFDSRVFHIDTACFTIKRDILTKVGQAWYAGWGADRLLFQALKQYFGNYACTNKYSVNYRLGGNEGSVTKEFFEQGNEVMKQKYQGNYPWVNGNKVELQVGPGITIME
jgi:glycosyltransferase involved in cell wall biosynthesis